MDVLPVAVRFVLGVGPVLLWLALVVCGYGEGAVEPFGIPSVHPAAGRLFNLGAGAPALRVDQLGFV